MPNAYLHYESAASFGVIATAAVRSVPLPASRYPVPLVVSAGADAVLVWSVRKGDIVARFSNADIRKTTTISSLAVSPDGRTIAAGYKNGSVRIWSVVFDGSLDVLPEKQPTATFNGHRAHVTSIAFQSYPHGNNRSLDCNRLVTASADGDLIMWDLSGESGLFRLPAHTDVVTSVLLIEHDGMEFIISSSKDGLVRVYDVASQHCVQTLVGHRAEVWAMDLDPTHSLLLTGTVDAEVRVFRFLDQSKLKESESPDILEPLGSVQRQNAAARVSTIHCAYTHGELFAIVAGNDRTAELFRVRTARDAEKHKVRRKKRFAEKLEKQNQMEAFPENEQATFVDEVIAKDFLVSVRPLRMPSKFRGVSLLSDQYHLSAAKKSTALEVRFLMQTSDNALEIYKVIASKKAKKRMRPTSSEYEDLHDNPANDEVGHVEKVIALDRCGHRGDVRSISLSPDDRLLLSTSKKALKLWNIAEGSCIRSMQPSGFGLCTSFLGADGSFGAVGTKEGALEIFDLGSGLSVTKILNAHTNAVWSMALDKHLYAADELITAGADKMIRFWSIDELVAGGDTLKPKRKLSMPDEVLCVCVAKGRDRPVLLAALMDSTIRAVYLDSLESAMNFYGHKLPVMSMDVSSDGLVLATGSADKTVKLWGIDFGDCRRSLKAHSDSVVSVVFQPKTHYLFTGSRDGTLKYWDADKFEHITDLAGQRGEVWSIAVSDDGELLASASHDKMMRVWRRTDEPLFLLEEQDRRMDEMFDNAIIEDDIKQARKERGKKIDFLEDANDGEALRAGRVTLDTVKGGERLLKALGFFEEEEKRDEDEPPNIELLGMKPEMYLLKTLESIRAADLEEVVHVLPLKQAVQAMRHITELLADTPRITRLSTEVLVRVAIEIVRIHQNQIVAGACSRKLLQTLAERMERGIDSLRKRFGVNQAALDLWQGVLENENDRAFRDAASRAHNRTRKRQKKAASIANSK